VAWPTGDCKAVTAGDLFEVDCPFTWFTVAEEDDEVEERALDATERTEELSEDTEDTVREDPPRCPAAGKLDSSTDLNCKSGDLVL
jgi:hypothetical protein